VQSGYLYEKNIKEKMRRTGYNLSVNPGFRGYWL